MSSFWQFLVDLLILQVLFTGMQYVGFAVLFLVFAAEVAKMTVEQRRKRQARRGQTLAEEDYVRV